MRLKQFTEEAVKALGIPPIEPRGHAVTTDEDEDDGDMKTLVGGVDLGDKCPACKSNMLFGSLSMAVCVKGHRWGKCGYSFLSEFLFCLRFRASSL